MKLIIQIPAFNEEKTLERAIRDLPKKIEGINVIETLVIDDGSSDRTSEVARKAGVNYVVRLISNRGLAAAFTAGIDAALRAGADIVVNTDADNQYHGSDIVKLVRPILEHRAEVVIGDRDVRNSPHMGPIKRLLQRLGSWAVGIASGVHVPDVTSGFRAFSRDAAFQINVFNPFTYTLETIIQAGNRNLQVETVTVQTNPPTRDSRLYRGMTTYIRKSVFTIFRIYTLYKPLKTFFFIGALLFFGGVVLGARFLYYYFTEGSAGHIQSLILAAVLLIIGFQTMLIGLVADLISVNRRLSEEVLVRLKKLEGGARKERRRHDVSDPKRGERRLHPPPPASPARSAETQWVWLVDEAKIDERGETPEVPVAAAATPTATKRRRRRRRTHEREKSVPRDPHPHHRRPEPDNE